MPAIRRATAHDGDFLRSMLAVAADWRPGAEVRSVADLLIQPELAHYVADWPLPGDVGFVAEDDRPLGAAWWRFLSSDDPGYGFVAETIPEVSIGVTSEVRGRGLGTQLLQALIDEAHRQSLPGISLSVEVDNPAARLYERVGFVSVGRVGGSATMLWSPER